MRNEDKKNCRFPVKYLVLLFVLAWVCFIFGNSMQNAVDSAVRSGQIVEIVEETLEKVGVEVSISDFFVRKAAHFIEYLILGIGLMLLLRQFTIRIWKYTPTALFAGLLLPMADESIQILFAGRGPALTDVWLDFSGVLTGFFLTGVVLMLLVQMRGRKKAAKIPFDEKKEKRHM